MLNDSNRSKGRPKGSKNIKSFDAELLAKKLGVDPLEILLRMAAGDWEGLGYDNECYISEKADGSTKAGYTITPQMRADAAAQACKYFYSTKQAVQVSTADSGFRIEVVNYEDLKK